MTPDNPNNNQTFPLRDKTHEELNAALAKWTPAAESVEPSSPGMPVDVLATEAVHLCFNMVIHWEPQGERPGMKFALVGQLIEESTAFDIRDVALAMSHANMLYRAVDSASQAPAERGQFLLYELKHCLRFIFDDDVQDDRDAELARLSESHTETDSYAGLAMSLEGFAIYANRYREELSKLPDFDVAMIDEALVVSQGLREHGAIKQAGMQRSEQQRYLRLRNGLVTLLEERTGKARRAGRFVFRNYPKIASRFTSAYERRTRARRRAAKETTEAEAQPSGSGATQEASA